ncbi:MAG TPA: hypothetical protein VGO11_07795 [Chthoniobacteraceae bacterium]|nr:hypothetical protein [Chthoniobacteraceae bacterium]
MNSVNILRLLCIVAFAGCTVRYPAPTAPEHPSEAGTYRHSGRFEEEVLYCAKGVAIFRSVRYYDSDSPEILYGLATAHKLEGGSDAAGVDSTDYIDSYIVSGMTNFCWDRSHHIVFGIGTDSKASDLKLEPDYFLFDCETAKVTFYPNELDLRNGVMAIPGAEFQLIKAELSFRILVDKIAH